MVIVPQWSLLKIRSRLFFFSPSQKIAFLSLILFSDLFSQFSYFLRRSSFCHVSRHRDWSHFQGHFNIKVFLVLSPSYSSFPGQTTGTPIPARFPFLPRKLATGLRSCAIKKQKNAFHQLFCKITQKYEKHRSRALIKISFSINFLPNRFEKDPYHPTTTGPGGQY